MFSRTYEREPPPKRVETLDAAICEVNLAVAEMRSEHDPLASHIFLSRRRYQNMPTQKVANATRRQRASAGREACDLGFRGDLREWERLLGAALKRLDFGISAAVYMRAENFG